MHRSIARELFKVYEGLSKSIKNLIICESLFEDDPMLARDAFGYLDDLNRRALKETNGKIEFTLLVLEYKKENFFVLTKIYKDSGIVIDIYLLGFDKKERMVEWISIPE